MGKARQPFEGWCAENNYDQNVAMVAAWLAFTVLTHEQRAFWFSAVRDGVQRGFDLGEIRSAAIAAGIADRPAEPTTGSRPASRRAG